MNVRVIILIALSILASLWLGTQIAQGNVTLAISVIVFIGIPSTILAIGRDVSYPGKILLILVLGFAATGKGFAYLAIVEPLFPAELILAVMMLIVLFNFGRRKYDWFSDNRKLNNCIIIFIVYSIVNLVVHFSEYKMFAIRDSSLAYYMLFFFLSYGAFRDTKSVKWATNLYVICFWLTVIIKLCIIVDLNEVLSQFTLRGRPVVIWSSDSLILYASGMITYSFSKFINTKRLRWFCIALLCFPLMVIGSKTAMMLAILCVLLFLALCGRKSGIIMGGVTLVCGIGILIVMAKIIKHDRAGELYDKFEADLTSLSLSEFESGTIDDGTSTTRWRIAWWSTITRDTMAENPLFGLGYGADIESNFAYEFWQFDASKELNAGNVAGSTRYPHNVFFTVLGRLGIAGVIIFMTLIFIILKEGFSYARYARRCSRLNAGEMGLWGVIIGGTVNGFVQATYEVPYGAVTYWIALGLVIKMKQLNPNR